MDQSGGLDACWPWTACRQPSGYGQFRFVEGAKTAHRIAWILAHGPIPPKMLVCHACDNPACCNPLHLWLGTHKENQRDKLAKGRLSGPKGETHPCASLTEVQVRQIRRLAGDGWSFPEIAPMFDVHSSQVCRIVNRKAWASVE